MEVTLQNLGKKFSRHWIFRAVNLNIPSGSRWAIVGPNGSGKSTLLQIMSGARVPSEGQVTFQLDKLNLPNERSFQRISIAAPYIELIEELTLKEMFAFHRKFKPFNKDLDYQGFLELLNYPFKSDQVLKFYSSGMKQRIKLGLAIMSESDLVLLDEPCSNLDAQGKKWYQNLVDLYIGNRTLCVASNDPFEYQGFENEFSLDQS